MAMIYRQPVEAEETANVAVSGDVGVTPDEANTEPWAVRCAGITNKSLNVRILNDALKTRSVK